MQSDNVTGGSTDPTSTAFSFSDSAMQHPVVQWLTVAQVLLFPSSSRAQSSSSSISATPVTTTALEGTSTPPADHWTPDRPDQYVCEYLGQNDCWRPSVWQDGGPYMGFNEERPERTKKCVVEAANDPTVDDAPAIRTAFEHCHENGHIVFENTTYYVYSVLNTTGLQNVDVEVKGTLEWNNDDIDYWRNNSLYIGFQNQTSAWFFGGNQVHFYGHGYGTLNGHGEVWYAYSNGTSNLHGRPHAITISDSKDTVIEGLRFIRSQMWTSTIARSEQILMQDIYVNNSCAPDATFDRCNLNTDGSDTVYANNITYLRWTYEGGDDAIAPKQNSTNIYVADFDIHAGSGIALGSIGQYPGQIEVLENITVRDVRLHGSQYGCRLKTFTGLNKGYPPNGGGGGIGHARNITCEGFTMEDMAIAAWSVNQKTAFDGQPGGSNTSLFQVEDLHFGNSHGTLSGELVTSFQCSAETPCQGIHLYNNSFTIESNGTAPSVYRCTNIGSSTGLECTDGCGEEDELCPS